MEQIRTFIAIELDESTKAGLAELQEWLQAEVPKDIVRWVRLGGIHLTLKFLGNVPATSISGITEALQRACRGFAPFSLTCGGLGCFPNPQRPRVVWVGVEEETGALARLQQAIEAEVAPLGYPTDKRSFHPHLTLGRAQRRAPSRDVRQLGEVIAKTDVGRISEMEVQAVSLMRSDLKPGGAVYTQLATVRLEGI